MIDSIYIVVKKADLTNKLLNDSVHAKIEHVRVAKLKGVLWGTNDYYILKFDRQIAHRSDYLKEYVQYTLDEIREFIDQSVP